MSIRSAKRDEPRDPVRRVPNDAVWSSFFGYIHTKYKRKEKMGVMVVGEAMLRIKVISRVRDKSGSRH